MTDTITVEQMKPKLLTLDKVRETLATTEPLAEEPFKLRDDGVKFSLEGWSEGMSSLDSTDPVGAYVNVHGKDYQLTKEALLEATSYIGLKRAYVTRSPGSLVEPALNYWFSNMDRELKLLFNSDTNRVLAVTRSSIEPFSNLQILDQSLAAIEAQYGKGEVLADYKFSHDLRRTNIRLIVPEQLRAVREGDVWSTGLQIQNSLTGGIATSIDGYLFRWWCTNGAIATHSGAGKYNRKIHGRDADSMYEWAREAVDEILGGLEHEFEALEELANTPLGGSVADVLADVFEQYRVPVTTRERIIENMVNSDDLTMYGVMQAITLAANEDGLSETLRTAILEIGGDLPRAYSDRCESCHRIMPS